MDNDKLPTIDDDNNEETAETDFQRTRPNPVYRDKEPTKELSQTSELPRPVPTPARRQPPPQGGHVQRRPNPKQPQPTGYPRRPRPKKASASDSGLYFPWWSLALMLLGVMVVSFALVGGVFVLRNSDGIFASPTPIIRIITAVPSSVPQAAQPTSGAPSTQIIAGGSNTGDLALTGPTLVPVQLTPTPVSITINSIVAVEGVDDNKLNVRDTAAVNTSTVLFRADEGEQFVVVDGPLQGDGFTWWFIEDPTNPTRAGWAVANFLGVVVEQ